MSKIESYYKRRISTEVLKSLNSNPMTSKLILKFVNFYDLKNNLKY